MYSRCIAPHEFGPAPEGDLIANVRAFFEQRLEAALKAGLTHQQIILDPGMGAFLHTEHGASIEMLNRLNELMDFGLPIMLGISRKGFLKKERERSIKDRDAQSVKHAMQVIQSLDAHDKFVNLYLRVHNVRAHAEALKVLAALR
jgi:dihydropteroate synthase